MGKRIALIIGNSTYEDTALARLQTPDTDVFAFAEVLKNPSIGGFDEVQMLVNASESAVRRSISLLFNNKKIDDLLLLYFSGHGTLDSQGRLFLAAKDTQTSLLTATAIPSAFLTEEMNACRSKRQILILDCCNSGAFERGTKGKSRAITQATFEGTGFGRVVMTASDSTQYALEGNQVLENCNLSLFTHFLVEGLRQGSADLDQDGRITLDEWYEYAYTQVVSQVPQQTPRKWVYNQQGDFIIAKNSCYDPFITERSTQPPKPIIKRQDRVSQKIESKTSGLHLEAFFKNRLFIISAGITLVILTALLTAMVFPRLFPSNAPVAHIEPSPTFTITQVIATELPQVTVSPSTSPSPFSPVPTINLPVAKPKIQITPNAAKPSSSEEAKYLNELTDAKAKWRLVTQDSFTSNKNYWWVGEKQVGSVNLLLSLSSSEYQWAITPIQALIDPVDWLNPFRLLSASFVSPFAMLTNAPEGNALQPAGSIYRQVEPTTQPAPTSAPVNPPSPSNLSSNSGSDSGSSSSSNQPNSSSGIENSARLIVIEKKDNDPGSVVISTKDQWWITNFLLSVDIKAAEEEDYAEGIVFRESPAGFYFAYIRGSQFGLSYYQSEQGKWREIIPLSVSDATKVNDTNRFSILVNGGSIEIFINDRFVGKAPDNLEQLNRGRIGVGLDLPSQLKNTKVMFDNLDLRIP